MSETVRGHFCWYDLRVPDPDQALDFYGPVMGWTQMPFEGASEPYDMFVAGEQSCSGWRRHRRPPRWERLRTGSHTSRPPT